MGTGLNNDERDLWIDLLEGIMTWALFSQDTTAFKLSWLQLHSAKIGVKALVTWEAYVVRWPEVFWLGIGIYGDQEPWKGFNGIYWWWWEMAKTKWCTWLIMGWSQASGYGYGERESTRCPEPGYFQSLHQHIHDSIHYGWEDAMACFSQLSVSMIISQLY